MKNQVVTFMTFFQKPAFRRFLYFFVAILWCEGVVRAAAFGNPLPTVWLLAFTGAAAALFALLCSMGGRVGTVVSFVLTAFLTVLYAAQLIYEHIFDSFFSLTQIAMGAAALDSFGAETALGIRECLGALALLLLPLMALVWLTAARFFAGRGSLRAAAILGVLFLALHFGTVLCLPLGGRQNYAPYDLYHDTFVLQMSERQFGVLTSARIEARGMLFGTKKKAPLIETEATTATTPDPETPVTPPDIPEVVYPYNVTDTDFAALAAAESDDRVRALDSYFASQSGTRQNAYTGMFKDYNLILLCCESFSPYLVDAERTPALYRMATEGFVFTDYYNTVCDNTSNGEYALCLGLLPDTSLLGRGWKNFYDFNSFTAAKENWLPYALGNQYRALGAKTYAVHNYFCDYYGRDKTHPNMGYDFKAIFRGMKKVSDWPTSDVSMIEQTLPDLLTPDESGNIPLFHAYYLTFSGHMYYNFTSNDMAIKNKAVSEGLPYSTATRAYISCQEELEYALETMNKMLADAGVADKTLIVLTADHYPYNLGLGKLSELAGKTLEAPADKYRSALYIWSPSMTAPVTVDAPCSTLDVLPTVSNLLGLPYDSRLLSGRDILAEGEHIAILGDRSFVTETIYYDAESGTATTRTDAPVDAAAVERLNTYVKNKFTVATEMLYTDYFAKVRDRTAAD